MTDEGIVPKTESITYVIASCKEKRRACICPRKIVILRNATRNVRRKYHTWSFPLFDGIYAYIIQNWFWREVSIQLLQKYFEPYREKERELLSHLCHFFYYCTNFLQHTMAEDDLVSPLASPVTPMSSIASLVESSDWGLTDLDEILQGCALDDTDSSPRKRRGADRRFSCTDIPVTILESEEVSAGSSTTRHEHNCIYASPVQMRPKKNVMTPKRSSLDDDLSEKMSASMGNLFHRRRRMSTGGTSSETESPSSSERSDRTSGQISSSSNNNNGQNTAVQRMSGTSTTSISVGDVVDVTPPSSPTPHQSCRRVKMTAAFSPGLFVRRKVQLRKKSHGGATSS